MKNHCLKIAILCFILCIILSFFLSCITDVPTEANVRITKISKGETALGSPCFFGDIENTGTKDAFYIKITIECFGSGHELIDTAIAYYGDQLIKLGPGEKARFEAPYYIATPQNVMSYRAEVDWE